MRYIVPESRHQSTLFPELLDDYISAENPVRFIDGFVKNLDMHDLDFTHSEPKETGRKPYNPKDLLGLYIYGYLNKIRSSRELEKSTHRNVEVMWLLGKLKPDHKTISDFRKENKKAIKRVCREFTLLCKRIGLFGGELIAIDGSKFSAVNHNNRSFTPARIKKDLEKINARIGEYLKLLDSNDKIERDNKELTTEDLHKKINELEDYKNKLNNLSKKLDESGENQINLTDPDSRMMKTRQGSDVSYNVQIVTDSKNKLISDHEVTNDINDLKQLSNMAIQAKETLGVEELEAVADAGYYKEEEIKKCHDKGIKCFIPKSTTTKSKNSNKYSKEDFTYDLENDCYYCPQKQMLPFQYTSNKEGKKLKVYYTTACNNCMVKPKCTDMDRSRRIYRWIHEELIENMMQDKRKYKEKIRLRKGLVEHPFGTLKRWMNHGYFLMKGIDNVGTEMSLSVLTYNIKRAINIMGVEDLIKTAKFKINFALKVRFGSV